MDERESKGGEIASLEAWSSDLADHEAAAGSNLRARKKKVQDGKEKKEDRHHIRRKPRPYDALKEEGGHPAEIKDPTPPRGEKTGKILTLA